MGAISWTIMIEEKRLLLLRMNRTIAEKSQYCLIFLRIEQCLLGGIIDPGYFIPWNWLLIQDCGSFN